MIMVPYQPIVTVFARNEPSSLNSCPKNENEKKCESIANRISN